MGTAIDKWTWRLGRWRGLELGIHAAVPLVALAGFLLAHVPEAASRRLVCWSLIVLLVSVALHEMVRLVAAWRVGGRPVSLVLAPVGGFSQIHLPADPPAHLLTSLAGVTVYLILALTAACGLALSGDHDVLRFVLHPLHPKITPTFLESVSEALRQIAELVVWVNTCLLLVDLLPAEPCAGAGILRGLLWPLVGRSTAHTATRHVALVFAILSAVGAVVFANRDYDWIVPGWFPLAVVMIFLLYASHADAQDDRYDYGIAIDELDSDDEEWLAQDWLTEDREAVLVEYYPDKQQEALERKRKEREASEDQRVDEILARLHGSSFDKLSEEERTLLKRASRRYQRRRGQGDTGR